jgi:hypothetical protein
MQMFNLRHAISYLFLLVQQQPINQSGGNKLFIYISLLNWLNDKTTQLTSLVKREKH